MTTLIENTLLETLAQVHDQITALGDVVVPSGCLTLASNGVRWVSINQNNHQQTLGVVASAIKAMLFFFARAGESGWVLFEIYDGRNLVGGGRVLREWEGPDSSGWLGVGMRGGCPGVGPMG